MELDFSKIKSKDDFMEWFSHNFKFPSYFGGNWDAVYDCLRDLNDSKVIYVKNKKMVYSNTDYDLFVKIIEDFNNIDKIKITLVESV